MLSDDIRASQGYLPEIEIIGKKYSFKKLKRRECHRVLYSLVTPYVTMVTTIMGTATAAIEDLKKGRLDLGKLDISVIPRALEGFPFEKFWDLACALLNGVVINGVQFGQLDDHDYYDDKQLELLQAMLASLRFNYPHIAALLKPGSGSGDLKPEAKAEVKQ